MEPWWFPRVVDDSSMIEGHQYSNTSTTSQSTGTTTANSPAVQNTMPRTNKEWEFLTCARLCEMSKRYLSYKTVYLCIYIYHSKANSILTLSEIRRGICIEV